MRTAIIVLLALCTIATPAQEPSPGGRLAAAEAKWMANKPSAYEFTYKQICFCSPLPPGTPGSEPIIFHVENGVGALTGG